MTSTVTLLTQHDCTLCEDAKQVLTRVGRDHRLDVQEISLDTRQGKNSPSGTRCCSHPESCSTANLLGMGASPNVNCAAPWPSAPLSTDDPSPAQTQVSGPGPEVDIAADHRMLWAADARRTS